MYQLHLLVVEQIALDGSKQVVCFQFYTKPFIEKRLDLQELRSALPDIDKMKFGFGNSALHKGKILFTAKDINFAYNTQPLWKDNLNFQITSGERIALKGQNGSGKTTLIKLILGDIEPQIGTIYRADNKAVYIDQDYSTAPFPDRSSGPGRDLYREGYSGEEAAVHHESRSPRVPPRPRAAGPSEPGEELANISPNSPSVNPVV